MIVYITIYVATVYLQRKYFRPELGDIMHASTVVVVLLYCIWRHVLLLVCTGGQYSYTLASFPGPAQLSVTCSTEKCVGRAWERG